MTLDTEQFQPFHDWWDSVYDDAKRIAALMGWRIDDIHFSGFWSQGDGACFTGSLAYKRGCAKAVREYAPLDTELHRIADAWQTAQRSQFYAISGTVKHAGHYSHEYSVSFDWEDSRTNYGWTNDSFDEDAFAEPARDFMRWIYSTLEREYEYQFAWNMATRWSDIGAEIPQHLSDARAAIRDYHATIRSKCAATLPDSVKQAAKRAIRSALDQWQEALTEREEIADAFHYWQDGKSIDVATFAASHI